MSRNVDLTKPLDEDEAAYLRSRPWLIRDAELQGLEIQWPGSEGESDASEDPEDDEDDEIDYNDLTIPKLKAEIDARNEGREEDAMIVPESDKKADLVAALEADDEVEDEDAE